ncbi:MAG: hypothetical protein ACM3RP_00050 [Chitinophagales bacterium]
MFVAPVCQALTLGEPRRKVRRLLLPGGEVFRLFAQMPGGIVFYRLERLPLRRFKRFPACSLFPPDFPNLRFRLCPSLLQLIEVVRIPVHLTASSLGIAGRPRP